MIKGRPINGDQLCPTGAGRFTKDIPAATNPRPIQIDNVNDSPRIREPRITLNKGVRNVKEASRLAG